MEETLTAAQIIASVQDPMTLVKHGIKAAKEERWSDGATILAAAYEQLTRRTELKGENALAATGSAALKDVVPANALSYYGLCLARALGNYQEGAKFIHIAIHNEPMVGEHYLILARLWQHARNRRKLVDAIEKGLEASPRYLPLRRLALEVGLRKQPVLPFLSRNNTLNQTLGRFRSKMEKKQIEMELARAEAEAARKAGRRAPNAPPLAPGVRSPAGARSRSGTFSTSPPPGRRPSKG
jgi:tetratricopeptide (TPR) repeat protein